jgi:putative ABC transport system ATP-binding protein
MKTTLAPSTLISVKNLDKQFTAKSGVISVLHDINFQVDHQSFTIIFGPSGSGKTTLLNVVSGLEPPSAGQVGVAGQDLYQLDADQRAYFRACYMGIVHQENYWVKALSVLENVAMPLYLIGSEKPKALQAAQASLEQVGMAEFAHHEPTLLSGGQQQRVQMARALVASPELILADEPTGNLDSRNGKMIIDLLLKCQRELGRTVILITHNIEYLTLADKQLYMLDGRVVEAHRGQKLPPDVLQSVRNQITQLTNMEHGL